jgi:hypothetical protein
VIEAPFNAADPAQVRKRQRTAKDAQEQQALDLAGLLKLPEFRRYVWRHMNESCGMLRSASSPNGSIQSQNIGMQDVGRILWAEIERVDAKAIPQMMVEYAEQQSAG